MPTQTATTLDVNQLKDRLAAGTPTRLIDVRTPEEFADGHVPGATNVPLETLTGHESLGDDVVVLCLGGKRAAMACDLLIRTHPNIAVLAGGTSAWVAAGEKLEKPTEVCSHKKRWSPEGQTRLFVGTMILAGTLLSVFVAPAWAFLPGFMACGLIFAGARDNCPMASLFALMPWNRGLSCDCD